MASESQAHTPSALRTLKAKTVNRFPAALLQLLRGNKAHVIEYPHNSQLEHNSLKYLPGRMEFLNPFVDSNQDILQQVNLQMANLLSGRVGWPPCCVSSVVCLGWLWHFCKCCTLRLAKTDTGEWKGRIVGLFWPGAKQP